jgi:hypothetical protein
MARLKANYNRRADYNNNDERMLNHWRVSESDLRKMLAPVRAP